MITMDEVGRKEDGDDEGKKDCSGYDSLTHIITYILCMRDKKNNAINVNRTACASVWTKRNLE